MTRAEGGRGHGSTTVALLLVVAVLWANDAWRRVGRTTLVLSVSVPVCALVVCLLAPTGWYGGDDAAGYALAALAVPAVIAYARTPNRRLVGVVAICAAGLLEFAEAFLPWWGGRNPALPMIGTFYWWNPYAAFLLPAAVLGAALAIRGQRPMRTLGWFAAPLCSAGIVFSSSRMTLALLVASLVVIGLVAADADRRRSGILRWLLVGVLAAGATYALAGPPVFDHRADVTAAAEAKANSGQTVAQNGAYRLQFWHRAVAVLEDRPLVGSGPHALVGASTGLVPDSYARSNLAHNGYLQVLSDGGLVLGLPFLLGCFGALLAGLRLLLSARRPVAERWLRIAVPIALAGSAAHSAVDFDWSHPSDLLLTALLAGLALAVPVRAAGSGRARWVAGAAVTVVAGVLAIAAWHTDHAKAGIAAVTGTPAQRAHALHETGAQPLRDYRWAQALLVTGAGSGGPVTDKGVAAADLRWAVSQTAAAAAVTPDLQLQRARALVLLGSRDEAGLLVDAMVARRGRGASGSIADQGAEVLAAAGRTHDARALVVAFLLPGALDDHAGGHLQALLDVDAGRLTDVDRCAYAAVAADRRYPNTPDPGAPAAGTSCEAVLRGAA
ncbi:MAG: exopolysaccharide production protein ExoQ [Frankiales bacterium]|jgi:O-antigen ligase|nr:exopolysaccharide production protein ExoQ [Frankiales bacterium]